MTLIFFSFRIKETIAISWEKIICAEREKFKAEREILPFKQK